MIPSLLVSCALALAPQPVSEPRGEPTLDERRLTLDRERVAIERERLELERRRVVHEEAAGRWKDTWATSLPVVSGFGAVLLAIVTFFLGRRAEREKVRDQLSVAYDQELRKERLRAYRALWKTLEPFALYAPPPLQYRQLADVSRELREWYFKTGGIFLSRDARDRYFALLWAIEQIGTGAARANRQGEPFNPDSLSPVDASRDEKAYRSFRAGDDLPAGLDQRNAAYRFVRALGSLLRTTMTQDVATRAPPLLSAGAALQGSGPMENPPTR